MQQTAMLGLVPDREPSRSRHPGASLTITLEVTDPEVAAELRRHADGDARERHALAALRVGVLAMRSAGGQVDTRALRDAGTLLVSEMRELLSVRAAEMTERISSMLGHYLDPASGALPQRLSTLVRKDGELDTMLRAHLGADDSVLARSLTAHLGEGSPVFKLLSPTEASSLSVQLATALEKALAEQRAVILKEFSLDREDSALSRLVGEFSLDADGSALNRLSKMMTATRDQIGKQLTLDDETSALARLRRELTTTIGQLAHGQVEFHTQVREAIARIDTRRKEEQKTPLHGATFEDRLGALLGEEAQRLGDLHEVTGDSTGVIRACKKGDHVVELGAEAAAAHARIVWEAKARQAYPLRMALAEMSEARRNRQAQVGVFVYARQSAPEGLESLVRHGSDVVIVWDAEDPGSDVVVRAAYSLSRALAVRQRQSDDGSAAALAEIDRAARSIERQVGYLDEVRRWAETVKGHGEKIAERTGRMSDELRREVEHLDAQMAALRKSEAP